MADTSLLVAKMTFVVTEITLVVNDMYFKVAVINSSVANNTLSSGSDNC